VIARDRRLDTLSDRFRPKAFEFLARCTEAGIMLCVVETRRSEEAHQEDLRNGRSWIKHSKHQDGDAMDVAPYETFLNHGPDKLNWDIEDPAWERMAAIAEKLGLVSGLRWKQKDAGHIEYP
jgi:hypothetical protein